MFYADGQVASKTLPLSLIMSVLSNASSKTSLRPIPMLLHLPISTVMVN